MTTSTIHKLFQCEVRKTLSITRMQFLTHNSSVLRIQSVHFLVRLEYADADSIDQNSLTEQQCKSENTTTKAVTGEW